MTAVGILRQRHRLAERGDDFYETPIEATLALLRVEQLPTHLWEPACGRGALVEVLREAGHEVIATDLVNHGVPITPPSYYGRDFLLERQAPAGAQAIITNPPFKLAEQFVEHALQLVPQVYMLLRLTFMESMRRTAILESGSLRRVLVFKRRLPMMHRAGWAGPKATSATAYAWYCWDTAHHGPTIIDRISWEAAP